MKEFDPSRVYYPGDKMLIEGEECIAVKSDGCCNNCVLKPDFFMDLSCTAKCSSFLGQRSDLIEIHFEKVNK